jgi:predicted signal transduction protein with EAL and GGDEF domain
MAEVFEIDTCKLRIGASIGIRLVSDPAEDAATLLSSADRALYAVKKSGGGGFSLAEETDLSQLQTS